MTKRHFLYRIICIVLIAVIMLSIPDSFLSEETDVEASTASTSKKEKTNSKKTSVATSGSISLDEGESDKFIPETLKKVNSFDYYSDSISTITDKAYTQKEIRELISKYGTYLGNPGMSDELYKETMEAQWTDFTDYTHEYVPTELDLNKKYTYNELVNFMRNLSRLDGVYMYRIGETSSGRPMYALEVDIASKKNKDTVILTGTIHARETAGCEFILKQLSELLQDTSNKAQKVLKQTRFVTVPCVNPDGRDGVCFSTKKYTYKDDQLWKATSSGTDLNRNFPGLSWGQLLKGYEISDYISDSPKKLYYPGDYAGSAPETRAMMKFLYHYIVVEQAALLVDYHMQGRIMYAGKPWSSTEQSERCESLAKSISKTLNVGHVNEKYVYWPEEEEYGLNGVGSTLTDYACAIAYGAKFSRGYGFCVYCTAKKEFPLISIPRRDKTKKNLLPEANPFFATFSFEIGWGSSSLGYDKTAREKMAKEYTSFHFDKVLYNLSTLVHQQVTDIANLPKTNDINTITSATIKSGKK